MSINLYKNRIAWWFDENDFAYLQGVQRLFDDGPVQGGPPLGQTPVLVIPDESQAGDKLHQLRHEHRGGGDEHVPGPGPGVPHAQPQHRILHGEGDQAHVLQTQVGRVILGLGVGRHPDYDVIKQLLSPTGITAAVVPRIS